MNARSRRVAVSFTIVFLTLCTTGFAQTNLGRISLFGTMQRGRLLDGTTIEYSEVTSEVRLGSPIREENGFEYAFDVRGSSYPSTPSRSDRTTIYDAWVGSRTANGKLSLRVGQVWLTDLGSVGSVGGLTAEYRMAGHSALGRPSAGIFGGLEPDIFNAAYVSGVTKGGGWIALDGRGNRRDVLGYVMIKDKGLVERSVLTTTNFIPVGKQLFLYQAAEYDMTGPGGSNDGKGLTYFFVNSRYVPTGRVELMGTYHHGRTIDARTITQDILNGRPVDQRSLDGFLYESAGGRLTVEVIPNVRVYGGYAKDRNNRDDKASTRLSAGIWAANIAKSGFDFTLSDNRVVRDGGDYDAWYASVGRSFGSRLYLSVDYSTSLSVLRFIDSGGAVVENRPKTKRTSMNGVWNLSRSFSLLVTAEQLVDQNETDDRGMLGLSYRF